MDKQSPEEREAFWQKFMADMKANYTFPTTYTYKFIVPTLGVSKETLLQIFSALPDANISQRESSNAKYCSISISVIHDDVEEIVAQYKKAEGIEGLISL
jgi:uncharacterized protein